MPGFVRSLAQRRKIAIILKGLGKIKKVKPRATEFFNETIPGIFSRHIGKKITEAPLVAGEASKARQSMPEAAQRFTNILFGPQGAAGRASQAVTDWVHKYRRSKIRAPGSKAAAEIAGTAFHETEKVVSQMGREALQQIGETKTGRILSGTHKVFQKMMESELPKVGQGLRPGVESRLRDVRHVRGLTGRLGLKLHQKLRPLQQRIRESAGRATGWKRTPYSAYRAKDPALKTLTDPRLERQRAWNETLQKIRKGGSFFDEPKLGPAHSGKMRPKAPESIWQQRSIGPVPEVTRRRREAAKAIAQGQEVRKEALEDIYSRMTRPLDTTVPGIGVSKKRLAASQDLIKKGFEEHRAIRRAVRHKGLEGIPLIETGLVGGALTGVGIKHIAGKIKEFEARKEARSVQNWRMKQLDIEKGNIRSNRSDLTDSQVEDAAIQRVHTQILLGQAKKEARDSQQHRAELEQLALQERRESRSRNIGMRKPDREQARVPRESTLNALKGKLGRIGELFGGGRKPSRMSRGSRTRRAINASRRS